MSKVKLFILGKEGRHIKAPLKVFLTTRPTLLKYTQQVEYKDPRAIKGKGKEVKAKTIDITGYFVRTGWDEYKQITDQELERLTAWMANHNTKPDDLTIDMAKVAIMAPLIVPAPRGKVVLA